MPSIAPLSSCQGTPLRTTDWDKDFSALVDNLASKGIPVLTEADAERASDVLSANPKDRHDQLMAILADHHSSLMNLQLANSALLLVAFGWLLFMQELLRGNTILAIAVTIAVAVLAIIYVAWILRIYRLSSQLVAELRSLQFMPASHYESRILTRQDVASYCGTQLVLYTLIVLFTWIIYFR